MLLALNSQQLDWALQIATGPCVAHPHLLRFVVALDHPVPVWLGSASAYAYAYAYALFTALNGTERKQCTCCNADDR